MLRHQIKSISNPNPSSKYPSAWDNEDDPYYAWQHDRHQSRKHYEQPQPKKFDKLGYAQYLARIGIKRGDILMSKSQEEKPVNEVALCWLSVVVDIQEIHYLVEYGNMDYKPKCAHVQGLSKDGTPFLPYWACPDHYIIVKVEQCSKEAQESYAKAYNKSPEATS